MNQPYSRHCRQYKFIDIIGRADLYAQGNNIDQFQSATYQHTATTWDGQRLTAHFADWHTGPSVYRTPKELVAAGLRDWRERVRETAARS